MTTILKIGFMNEFVSYSFKYGGSLSHSIDETSDFESFCWFNPISISYEQNESNTGF